MKDSIAIDYHDQINHLSLSQALVILRFITYDDIKTSHFIADSFTFFLCFYPQVNSESSRMAQVTVCPSHPTQKQVLLLYWAPVTDACQNGCSH